MKWRPRNRSASASWRWSDADRRLSLLVNRAEGVECRLAEDTRIVEALVSVKAGDLIHLIVGQGKVEDIEILPQSLWAGCLGNDSSILLDRPAKDDLGRAFAMCPGNLPHNGLLEDGVSLLCHPELQVRTCAEGGEPCEGNVFLSAEAQEFFLHEVRVSFNLEDRWRDFSVVEKVSQE